MIDGNVVAEFVWFDLKENPAETKLRKYPWEMYHQPNLQQWSDYKVNWKREINRFTYQKKREIS